MSVSPSKKGSMDSPANPYNSKLYKNQLYSDENINYNNTTNYCHTLDPEKSQSPTRSHTQSQSQTHTLFDGSLPSSSSFTKQLNDVKGLSPYDKRLSSYDKRSPSFNDDFDSNTRNIQSNRSSYHSLAEKSDTTSYHSLNNDKSFYSPKKRLSSSAQDSSFYSPNQQRISAYDRNLSSSQQDIAAEIKTFYSPRTSKTPNFQASKSPPLQENMSYSPNPRETFHSPKNLQYRPSSPEKSKINQYITPDVQSNQLTTANLQEPFNPYERRKPSYKSLIDSPQSFGSEQRRSTYNSPIVQGDGKFEDRKSYTSPRQPFNPYEKKSNEIINPFDRISTTESNVPVKGFGSGSGNVDEKKSNTTNPYHRKSNSDTPYEPRKSILDSSKLSESKKPNLDSSNPYQHSKTKSSSSTNPYDTIKRNANNDFIQNGSKSPKIIINDDPVIPNYPIQKKFKKQANYNMKIVVVGDGGCGKTCLLVAYVQNKFPEIYVPTVFENYVTNVTTPNNKIIELALWDTAGQEEYDRLRPLSYPDVDIVLICFSLDNLTSLQNVKDIWFPEINHFCPGIPVILVGTKSDLPSEIDPDLPMQLATEINAIGYIQCSAKNMFNIHTVFNFACNHFQKQMELQEQMEKSSKHRLSKVLGNNKSIDSATHSRKRSSLSKGHFKNTSYDSTVLLDQPLQEDDFTPNPYGNFGNKTTNVPKYNEDEFAFTRKNEKKKKKCVIL